MLSNGLSGPLSADPGRRYPSARLAREALDRSRAALAADFGVPPAGVFVAPDRPTATWWALTGHLPARGRLVVSQVEALDVLRASDLLAAQGADRSDIGVHPTGRVDLDALGRACDAGPPAVVVVQAANLEIGTCQDLAEVRRISVGHVLVTDLQAVVGRCELSHEWDVGWADAQMWGGPPGVAVVAVRDPARFRPRIPVTDGHGRVEPDFPPVPLVATAAVALQESAQDWESTAGLSDHLRRRVHEEVPDVSVLGDPDHGLPYLTMLSVLYAAADEMVDALGRKGWEVSSGASCTSDTRRPHHVLVAVGALTHGTVRVSVTPDTTIGQVDEFVADLAEIVRRARAEAGVEGL